MSLKINILTNMHNWRKENEPTASDLFEKISDSYNRDNW